MADEIQTGGAEDAPQTKGPQFHIQRIYCKDISFETPNSPAIFTKEWKPEMKVDMDTKSTKLEDNNYEVVLTITLQAKVEDQTAFLVEVQQAGIFLISEELPEPQKAHMIGAFCPNTLFPYARETVATLINKGTFPVFNLQPVNFDAIFAQYMQKRAQQAQAEQAAADAPLQ